ncbi:MAG TPA: hypothetical protein VGW40_08945 [Allosphingosinicella sp.]|nr:hypothetical protein [Allosphingosinicella sp.]
MSEARPLVAGATFQVGHARLHGGVAGDCERLRSHLDGVRPAAFGLAEGAILLVPRLVARRRLPRHGDGGLFAGDVAEALQAALRRARRPGEARSRDDALLFLDEMEAAATLLAQWLTGATPADRAWWPQLIGCESPPAWLRRRILADARRLPTLVAILARRGLAEALLGRLEPEDVRVALAALAAGCGLSLPAPRPLAPPPRAGGDPGPAAPETAEAFALVEAIVPEARRAALAPPARLLLLVALLAERRPAMLATRAAGAAFAAVASARLPPAGPEERRRRGIPPAAVRARRPGVRPAGAAVSDPVEPRPGRAAAIESVAAAAEIATEYGGLLFLLNALLALGIYGDFSRPERALPGLSPFGLLRLLGRAWFGRPFIADPLHPLLVGLAGGCGADAARDFEAPPWSVPRNWLAPWPKAGPALVGGHRLRPMLWHPARFPLAELDPADPAAAERAARRLGLRGVRRRAGLPSLPAPPRARWIACLRRYLEARLARGLDRADPADAVATLCRRPARAVADDAGLTVRFRLDDHALAIRLAGLDRDPGWIPAARRDVRILFE